MRVILALTLSPLLVLAAEGDWLLDPAPFRAAIITNTQALTLENGLVRRTIRLTPNAATIDYKNLRTGEQLLRATGPEARVTINGTDFAIGGLFGQPCQNFLKAQWIESLHADPGAYRFAGWKEEPTVARFAWRKRPEWMSADLPWPAPGKTVTLRFVPPAGAPLQMAGPALFEEGFLGPLDAAWKIRISDKNPRSSFSNEGKAGEIYTPPDTSVYAERPWPANAVSVEGTLDTGDDTQSNSWGPGLALVTPGGVITFVLRPASAIFEVNGAERGTPFDRAKPCQLRVRLEGKSAFCEAAQDGRPFTLVARVDCPQAPTALRVGKVGKDGSGQDYPGAKGDPLIRCHVSKVTLRGAEPASQAPAPGRADLPEIDVHYKIYDGLPLIEKWLTIRNTSAQPVRVNKTLVESMKVQENESSTESNPRWELPSLYVETDYAYMSMTAKGANQRTVRLGNDPSYGTQVSYFKETPALLEVGPEFGPDAEVEPGGTLVSVRAFELFRDSSDRERRGLSQRRMYRAIAPWTQENPVLAHLISSDPKAIRNMVDQCAEVGFEMLILSFGSGMNMESRDAAYQARYKEVADYAKSKGIAIGAYSLLASRGAATGADNCRGPGNRVRYGVMPCLGAKWGMDYLAQLKSFMTQTGFELLEHDGSYPGDTCAATDHPGHGGLEDSQWVQFRAIADLYQWCRGQGIYLNIPDWYYLNGSTKCGMNYKENNWSLPRAEQEIIERQNIFDGTWEKTSSMGWMFVPLTQYHGGGAAATIEPLSQHLDHYGQRLANLFGAGVQACYRGPRLYDTDETKALVKKWVDFYRKHRAILDSDILHLRRPDGRDLDYILHVNPALKEKGLLMVYNPLETEVTQTLQVPLYYTGLTDAAAVREQDAAPRSLKLARDYRVELPVRVPARGTTWFVFE